MGTEPQQSDCRLVEMIRKPNLVLFYDCFLDETLIYITITL